MRKTVFFMIIMIMMLGLCSCAGKTDDPIEVAKNFDKKDYEVVVAVDNEDINDFADEFEIRGKEIRCIVAVCPNDGYDDEKMGVFIYCNDGSSAKKMVEDLEEFIDKNKDFDEEIIRCVIKKDGDLVFIGCEDAWEELN